MRHFTRVLFLTLLLIVSGLGAYYWVLPLGAGANLKVHPLELELGPADRVLVFAPHPDDETVGAGGFIQLALNAGSSVKVVFLSCGDAFRYAAQRRLRLLKVTPESMQAFGRLRQKEALAATAALGLPPEAVVFLGFPDRGLAPLWETHWSVREAYRSPYTGVDAAPYSNSFTPGAAYSGQVLLTEIEALIRQEEPTVIIFPSPHEGHPDHWATSAFVSYALADLALRGDWPGQPAVYMYLVHYTNWPRPWGANLMRNLEPPPPIAQEGLWLQLELPWTQRVKKYNAILKYGSQTAVMRGFLTSFARANELFQAYPEPEVLRSRDGFEGQKTLALDPTGDSIIDRLDRDADVIQLDGAATESLLRFWLRFRGPVRRELTYKLEVVALGGSRPGRRRVELRYPASPPEGTYAVAEGNTLTFTIERSLLGDAREVFLAAETYQGRVRADRLAQVRVKLEE